METEILQLLQRLSPSNQRLVHELIHKLSEVDQSTFGGSYAISLPYSTLADLWLDNLSREGKSPGTISQYKSRVLRLLSVCHQPGRADIERYLADISSAGRPINQAVFAFKSFFSYLANRDLISQDPTAKLKPPRNTTRERKPARPEDVWKLLNLDLGTRERALLLLLIDCGVRVSELAGVEVSKVREKSVTVMGKGRKERSVPISPLTSRALQIQIDEIRHRGYTGPWLFPGKESSNNHINDNTIRRILTELCHRVGIPRLTPHQIRHYFSTEMLLRGAALIAVSKMLGHARVSTTADIYWHVLDERELHSQHERFGPLSTSNKQAEVIVTKGHKA